MWFSDGGFSEAQRAWDSREPDLEEEDEELDDDDPEDEDLDLVPPVEA